MHFLHTNRIVHLDLKSANILLSRDGNIAKIADVGLARTLNTQCDPCSHICREKNTLKFGRHSAQMLQLLLTPIDPQGMQLRFTQ